MAGLAGELPEWTARGVAIVGVYSQSLPGIAGLAESRAYPFPIVVDEDRSVARAFGVHVRINLESWNMARPSVFLVGAYGRIEYLYVGSHQLDWPPSERIWAAADALK